MTEDLDGTPVAPGSIIEAARARGPLAEGQFRVLVLGAGATHHDFATRDEAQQYADDVASEEGGELIACILDDQLRMIGRGKHYAAK